MKLLLSSLTLAFASTPDAAELPVDIRDLVEDYCIDCHDGGISRGDLDLDGILDADPTQHPEIWEKVLLRLQSRQMPPADEDYRPGEAGYQTAVSILETHLDHLAALSPDPGRTDTIRRLTRFEYQNAIRDLLALDVEVAELLPKDESSGGFDNITLGSLSPTLIDRYIRAAQKISRLAVGIPPETPAGRVIRLAPDLSQEDHVEGLPLGTRGGALIPHTFPVAGEYEIQVRLMRDRNEEVEGLSGEHVLELLLDDESLQQFTIRRPKNRDSSKVDAHLTLRRPFPAGPSKLGVTFIAKPDTLEENKREPYDANFNMHRHPRRSPAVYQVSITGPFSPAEDAAKDTPSRRRIFNLDSGVPGENRSDAREILARLARAAFRRPITDDDIAGAMAFYDRCRSDEGSFEEGIEAGLSAILVSPKFLLRIEDARADLPAGTVHAIDAFELASRLSFFLWSSIPDEELLALAESGELLQHDTLQVQARRLLSDPRADALVTNFAGQWLHLRNLNAFSPDLRLYPDFDDNLRQAMRRESELLFAEILQSDRPLSDFITADFTYLNERLATHYGIPGIVGSHFRRVSLDPSWKRGGLLRHGSVLAVTSYANRTSPVIRGNWVLETVLGTPTPPPPPDIPALEDAVVSASLPMRERLAAHREDKSCATCHKLMDPIGFALENYDATGRWRDFDLEIPVDATGGLPDGTELIGPDELEQAILQRPYLFARALTEKLLTYSLGRKTTASDQPTIRSILRASEPDGYRLQSLILGIVTSDPFTKRKTNP
ncbi:DUF1592 domain-containing protein [Haloferula rosea]|uniref:DUF1592 domain-containing protein n=1 Tax=Haloferula rosea TaxID=490093 RepID=A0A934R834_9BACT|nr:DUF1592 domain-containing protein [Haloferula rosea]MBK1826027.1 DUF1592 domain-containing protein [Haloferula rosea]